MTHDRVHACLDGELSRDRLTADERVQLAELEWAASEAVAVLRSAPVPDFTARVMGSLPASRAAPAVAAADPAGWWARLREWAWAPRSLTIRYRPAFALAGMAAVALAGVVVPRTGAPPAAPQVVQVPALGSARLYVQFRLEAPEASRVELAGSFTGWKPEYQLREAAPGVWTAMVPLDPGVHDYTFLVDGEQWVVDPLAPSVRDSFGGSNSRLFLPPPAGKA